MRFVIHYRVGNDKREAVIEARTIDEAERVANRRYKHWEDLKFQNNANAKEILEAV